MASRAWLLIVCLLTAVWAPPASPGGSWGAERGPRIAQQQRDLSPSSVPPARDGIAAERVLAHDGDSPDDDLGWIASQAGHAPAPRVGRHGLRLCHACGARQPGSPAQARAPPAAA